MTMSKEEIDILHKLAEYFSAADEAVNAAYEAGNVCDITRASCHVTYLADDDYATATKRSAVAIYTANTYVTNVVNTASNNPNTTDEFKEVLEALKECNGLGTCQENLQKVAKTLERYNAND